MATITLSARWSSNRTEFAETTLCLRYAIQAQLVWVRHNSKTNCIRQRTYRRPQASKIGESLPVKLNESTKALPLEFRLFWLALIRLPEH